MTTRTMVPSPMIAQLVYEDVGEAADWLCTRLGLAARQ
jgi:hypothetical protein